MEYHRTFPDLAGVVLEDSWVLDVAPHARGVAFRLDAVLTPEHRNYERPRPGEARCYRRGWLTIESDAQVEVSLSGARPATDADDETDVGHIDLLHSLGDGRWSLNGDWGSVSVTRPTVRLILD